MTAMRMKAGTCAVFVLPLALVLAAQGGSAASCKGGAAREDANAAKVTVAAGGSESGVEQGGGKSAEAGTWGGTGVRLEVDERGTARVEFDCAHGTFEKLAPDAEGNFSARGLFVKERGGPARSDESEREGEPARYTGKVEGKTMTLRVSLEGSDEDLGTYTLTHGRGARLRKCL